MTFRVVLTDEARRNAREIRDWLSERSASGAERWVGALEDAIARLEKNPFLFSLAPENEYSEQELRNALFKTPRGRVYRAIFYVTENTVTVTHIRGPGQRALPAEELRDI